MPVVFFRDVVYWNISFSSPSLWISILEVLKDEDVLTEIIQDYLDPYRPILQPVNGDLVTKSEYLIYFKNYEVFKVLDKNEVIDE